MPNFACFSPLKFLGENHLKFWIGIIKIEHISEHSAKFHGNWPTELGDLVRGKKNNKCQQNISLLRKLLLPGGLIALTVLF